ncbi:FlgO family outer membrane protein [Alteromonas sp. ASW11-36]|uniref:FlgO family outer membrane protein n=1 Tax=Alteromonas arenosi TaxID=3055817 RepID=A0ABT7SVU5_9ALTE|nr:FlgO family outer membrane protein [Alteromonas sp. ASW11-36]MDM7860321.1 FlgO family outer membrane protein [Alteromonas sp. ASW11-36]
MGKFLSGLIVIGGLTTATGCTVTETIDQWLQPAEQTKAPRNRNQPDFEPPPIPAALADRYRQDSRDMLLEKRSEAGEQTLTVDTSMRDRIPTLYETQRTHKSLRDYAAQLAMALMDRAIRLNPDDLIGVVSFVDFDDELTNSNPVGNQLSEYFIGEIQQFGVSVVDFKVTESIQVGPRGDFALSRDAEHLVDQLAMDHILTGTLIYRSQGVSVNARIVELETRRVVATANVMIPDFIVAEIDPYLSQR